MFLWVMVGSTALQQMDGSSSPICPRAGPGCGTQPALGRREKWWCLGAAKMICFLWTRVTAVTCWYFRLSLIPCSGCVLTALARTLLSWRTKFPACHPNFCRKCWKKSLFGLPWPTGRRGKLRLRDKASCTAHEAGLGHLRVVCSWTLLLFHCSSGFSWVSEWSLTTNPFDGNLSFPALWKTDKTSFLDNCSPLTTFCSFGRGYEPFQLDKIWF